MSAPPPEAIAYIREWAKSGNEPRLLEDVSSSSGISMMNHACATVDIDTICLNDAGLTIAALADALEQANECIEGLEEVTGHGYVGTPDALKAVKELLGE